MSWHGSVLHSFFWLINVLLYEYTRFYLSIDRHLGCCHFFVSCEYAGMGICAQVFVWMYVNSLGSIPRSGIPGLNDNSVFSY